MIKDSAFRTFCRNIWHEHREEIFMWTNQLVEYNDQYYFNKHKWMLKHMFKEQNNAN